MRGLARRDPVSLVVADWEATYTGHTLKAYRSGLRSWAEWRGLPSTMHVVCRDLLTRDVPEVRADVRRWVAAAVKAGDSPATVRQRAAAVRSLVKSARDLGLTNLELRIKLPRLSASQDRRGPPHRDVLRVLAHLDQLREQRGEAWLEAIEARAAVLLAHDSGLRIAEIASLRSADLEDGEIPSILVRRKGGALERRPLSRRAYLQCLELRWRGSVSLFGISASTIDRRIRCAGEAVGVTLRPHGLLHAATTHLAKLTGDARLCQVWRGHANLSTTQVYLDANDNAVGVATLIVAGELAPNQR